MSSGLYNELTQQKLLVPHVETTDKNTGAYKIIQPDLIPFISYPYEWSFDQLKDAALATLRIQQLALEKNLTLRDASAYNIQFLDGRPILIDTLSFEAYKEGEPWQAYRQFCQHFLAPLAVAAYISPELLRLSQNYIDGLPLELAAKLLPMRTQAKLGLQSHIHLHARMQTKHAGVGASSARSITKTALLGIVDSLRRTVTSLDLPKSKTTWGDYYSDTNYSPEAFAAKQQIVTRFADQVKPRRVIDLGANDGTFSRLMPKTALVISTDSDYLAVNRSYTKMKSAGETNLLPLLIDLTNPSPAVGWASQERQSFSDRAQADLATALALVHHLAIGNNVPLTMIAEYFASLARNLIIEFVPKGDSQVTRLLATREDIFDNYTPAGFEQAFGEHFEITHQQTVKDSKRIIYLMKRLT